MCEKVRNWECLFVHRKQGLFLSVYVDDIETAGRNQNMAPMKKKLMKFVDLGEPTSFLDHVYLGCTQCESEPNESIVDQCREMFESRFSATATEKITRMGENSRKNCRLVPRHGKHAKNALRGIFELANKKTE